MAELTIGAGYVRTLIDLAVSKGAKDELLFERSGIGPDDLADRDTRIPLARYQALMQAAKDLLQEPALGAQLGEAASLSDISIVGLICYAAETMGEAFAQANRFGRLVVEVDGHRPEGRFDISSHDGEIWLTDTRKDPNSFPELTESAFAMMVSSQARDFGVAFAKEVHFTHAGPDDPSGYDRIFKVPVIFGSDRNALLLNEAFTDRRISTESRYVFGIFSEHAEALLEELQRSVTVRGQVESLLIPILHTGDISMERITEKMGLGRQTLYRKLKAEGVTFEKLLDELRHKMAMHYLGAQKVSVNETAYLTGFSDPSAFSRAFRRWTGKSPGSVAK